MNMTESVLLRECIASLYEDEEWSALFVLADAYYEAGEVTIGATLRWMGEKHKCPYMGTMGFYFTDWDNEEGGACGSPLIAGMQRFGSFIEAVKYLRNVLMERYKLVEAEGDDRPEFQFYDLQELSALDEWNAMQIDEVEKEKDVPSIHEED